MYKFTQATLPLGKQGILKPDEAGYYRMPAGALNCHNASGAFYRATSDVLATFGEGSPLVRQLKGGYLRSERDHPSPEQYFNHLERLPKTQITSDMIQQAKANYLMRLHRHDSNRECGVISAIELCPNRDLQLKGIDEDAIIIMINIKPSGNFGPQFKASLDNPRENTALSIRSITDDEYINGKVYKSITDPLTFDWVPEPGIGSSNKWQSPALETFDVSTLKTIHDRVKNNTGLECQYLELSTIDRMINRQLDRQTKRVPIWNRWG